MRIVRAIVCMVAVLSILAPAAAASHLQPIGHVARDGTVLSVGWVDALGSFHELQNGDRLPEDAILITAYGPNNANGTIRLDFLSYHERHVERLFPGPDNTTVKRIVVERYDEGRYSAWFAAPNREFAETTYLLPTSKSPRFLAISYEEVSVRVVHHTAPVLWPIGLVTRGGQLAFFLSVMMLASMTWGAGSVTAHGILRRARYWPKMTKWGWFFAFAAIGWALYSILQFGYYAVTSVEWWWWTLPFYFVAVAVMLQVLPARVERWQLVRIEHGAQPEELVTPIREILVAEDKDGGHILVHSRSVVKAIYRLLGVKTPVTWNPGPPAWYGKNTNWEDPVYDVRRLYILDPNTKPDLAHPKLGWKPLVWKLMRPGVLAGKAHIPLSYQHTRPVAGFAAGLIGLSAVAKSREEYRFKYAELQARTEAGAVLEDTKAIDRVYAQLAAIGPPEEKKETPPPVTVPTPPAKGGASGGG